VAYELMLGRPPDPSGRQTYLPRLQRGDQSVLDLCAELARSPEFADRLSGQLPADTDGDHAADDQPAPSSTFIDVDTLLRSTNLEELRETADRYFRQALGNADHLMAKPVANVTEAPELLITFGTLLRGLKPLPGTRVLDFGAGTCWTSRILAQLGCQVLAVDISPAALEIGRQSFERSPLFGAARPPEFLVFDGEHFELDDECVDLVVCFDAFHHVPNPQTVLAEMARVLVPGGLAGFSEPGPHHSISGQSQFEMRNFGVLENNIVMDDIARWGEAAGFDDLKLAIFDANTYWCSLSNFESFLRGRPTTLPDHLRISHRNRRLFVLKKQGQIEADSRDPSLLRGRLEMTELVTAGDRPDFTISGVCRVTNTGTARWLPSAASLGAVWLGARLNGPPLLTRDLGRFAIPGDSVAAGETRDVPFRLDIPRHDVVLRESAYVEFDLTSEGVGWFAVYGSTPCIVPLS
jgi:SAM-dependent methyltransferase